MTVGQTATFNVIATGTAPLAYQSYKGGALISGAVGNSYTTPATVIGDNSSQYTVNVTNIAGTAISTPAILTVKNTVPVASLLTCSPSTPPYNTSVTLIPIFSGGTRMIGSAGIDSVDITASATSGSSYSTPALTTQKTYTLSVTSSGGATVSTTCTVIPTDVTISNISLPTRPSPPGSRPSALPPLAMLPTPSNGLQLQEASRRMCGPHPILWESTPSLPPVSPSR